MLLKLKTLVRPALRRAVLTAGLDATALLSGVGLFPKARGEGAIFTLHHVRAKPDKRFHPNENLEITPEFLDTALRTLKSQGYEFVALADLPARLARPGGPPVACFTLDDGYRDNRDVAAPVFRSHGAPYTIFLTGGFLDATHSMWWETLDSLLNRVERFDFDFGQGVESVEADCYSGRCEAFDRVAAFINANDETSAIARLDEAARAAGIDPLALTRDLTMREDEIRALAADPLASFGAHTVSHRGLARLSAEQSRAEIAVSAERIAAITGKPCAAFAYPYGDERSVAARERGFLRELGIAISVTTRPGTLRPAMVADMTAVPRISLNGYYQKARHVRALASGIPFVRGR